jgi:hypothetical protein
VEGRILSDAKTKGGRISMVKTSTRIVGALALAAAMASSGPVLAAKPGNGGGGPGLLGALSQTRESAFVTIPVTCDNITLATNQTQSAIVSLKIFQSVGRLINIGTGSAESACTSAGQLLNIQVEVKAIEGLNFQPGPATILKTITQIVTTTTTTPPVPPATTPTVTVTVNVIEDSETGARIDLRP